MSPWLPLALVAFLFAATGTIVGCIGETRQDATTRRMGAELLVIGVLLDAFLLLLLVIVRG